MVNKKTLVVVLVEPSGPINVGSVARLCENFSVQELRIVSPKCDYLAQESKKMAVRGLRILEKASLHKDINAALSDCSRVIATCGRKEHGDIPLNSNKEALCWALKSEREEKIALVFGREDRGLSNEELLKANKKISYPANLIKLEDCINDAGSLLLDIGFLMKHTYEAKMAKIKKLLIRGEIKDDEVALIRGIISQARWKIKNKND